MDEGCAWRLLQGRVAMVLEATAAEMGVTTGVAAPRSSVTLLEVLIQMFPEPSMAMVLVVEGKGWPDAPRRGTPELLKPSRE